MTNRGRSERGRRSRILLRSLIVKIGEEGIRPLSQNPPAIDGTRRIDGPHLSWLFASVSWLKASREEILVKRVDAKRIE